MPWRGLASGPKGPPRRLEPFGTLALPPGSVVHRVYRRGPAREPTTFNPCLGRPTRFAPLYVSTVGGGPVTCEPTLYAGASFRAAVFESLFRDLPPQPKPRRVRERDVVACGYALLSVRRPLNLAALFNPNLGRIGLTRQDLIERHGERAYRRTVRWAAAIHRSLPDVDGLAWTSRQDDQSQAFMFFRSRVDPGDLEVGHDVPLDDGLGRAMISDPAAEFLVDIIPLS